MNTVAVFRNFSPPSDENEDSVGHPCHRGFANTIDADIHVVSTQPPDITKGTILEDIYTAFTADLPSKYDSFLITSSAATYLLPRLRHKFPNADFIVLSADWRIAGLQSYRLNHGFPKSTVRKVDRKMDMRILSKTYEMADGAIAGTPMMASVVKKRSGLSNVAVSPPYIRSEVEEELSHVSWDPNSRKVIVIGEGREHKGFDRLIENWDQVRQDVPTAELHVVGPNNHDPNVDGVTVHGYVESIADVLDGALCLAHPSRIEPAGAIVLEALYAGLPVVVTEGTGFKHLAEKAPGSRITPNSMSGIVNGVISILKSPPKEIHSDDLCSEFTQNKALSKFNTEFSKLCSGR